MSQGIERRTMLQGLAAALGGVVLMPSVACVARAQSMPTGPGATLPNVPMRKPESWDPVEYNRVRGNAGAIPESYLGDINGPDGDWDHLGKHLPYVPATEGFALPEGFLAIMWGDPAKGHTKHPNAVRSEANGHEGHWYNWIRVRVADEGEWQELESRYSDWPGTTPADNGAYAVWGGGDITAESGKNTVYLAALPPDARPGMTIRVWAHCLTHGEYVDFLTVPGA